MKKVLLGIGALVLPFAAFAQNVQFDNNGYLASAQNFTGQLINWLLIIVPMLAVIYFIWELIQFINTPADKKGAAKTGLLWSVVAMVLIFSIFGIIKLVQNTVGANSGGGSINQNIPTVQGF